MQDLIIYGAGGFGREMALMVQQINAFKPQWNLLGFCDDNKEKHSLVDDLPVLGGLSELSAHKEPLALVLAMADPQIRKNLKASITNARITYPALIHPSVILGDHKRNRIGEGVIITAANVITTNVHIGSFVIVNLACTIGHDVRIGAFSSIMPSCSLSGFITIGEEVLIGTGVRILPGVTIGERSKVGAGAVVTKPVSPGVTVVGIPAKEST